jgi:glycosyltransferase involved in cell wall biosynthesis
VKTGDQPLVSVIIPSFKMGEFISEALRSIGAQTYPNWEVMVVDDAGPEDGTHAAVTAFAENYPTHRIEYIRHAHNLGVSGARNTAIAAAKGELLAFLDPDDWWADAYLQTRLEALRKDPGSGLCTGPVVVVRGTNRAEAALLDIPGWQIEWFPESLATNNFIQPSAVVVWRMQLEAVGGFSTDPELQHIEDYDLWIRLALAGVRFTFVQEAHCFYRKHDRAATANLDQQRNLHAHLVRRHTNFFLTMHGSLLRRALNSAASSRRALSGPLARRAVWVDEKIRALRRRLRS